MLIFYEYLLTLFDYSVCFSYYTTFAKNMSNKYKEVYGAVGEVLGMILSYMQDSNHVRT